ncbi:hypothetical protein ANO14919_010550 [Xylariales sp. No.14919]|nr:hypothetical protein ANO14919_010550 [Xylariales sp. No.14919]
MAHAFELGVGIVHAGLVSIADADYTRRLRVVLGNRGIEEDGSPPGAYYGVSFLRLKHSNLSHRVGRVEFFDEWPDTLMVSAFS